MAQSATVKFNLTDGTTLFVPRDGFYGFEVHPGSDGLGDSYVLISKGGIRSYLAVFDGLRLKTHLEGGGSLLDLDEGDF